MVDRLAFSLLRGFRFRGELELEGLFSTPPPVFPADDHSFSSPETISPFPHIIQSLMTTWNKSRSLMGGCYESCIRA